MTARTIKRFYKTVAVAAHAPGEWRVLLDGRPALTPGRRPLGVPTQALAAAIAAEFDRQTERMALAAMPIARLAGAALDLDPPGRERLVDQLTAFCDTDLLCHRAEQPAELAALQGAAWDPVLAWARSRFGTAPACVRGVIPAAPAPEVRRTYRSVVAALDPFRLVALAALASATGSLLLGLAVLDRHLDAEGAWRAAEVDEKYQIEHWGDDAEARTRRLALRTEIGAAAAVARSGFDPTTY
jgi:chaperone required for assembly of F1-ATPase